LGSVSSSTANRALQENVRWSTRSLSNVHCASTDGSGRGAQVARLGAQPLALVLQLPHLPGQVRVRPGISARMAIAC
jgi:hypothetical protein